MADRPSAAATTEDPNAAAAALAYEQQYAQCKYLYSLPCLTRPLQRAFSFSLFYSPHLHSGYCHPPGHPVKEATLDMRDGGS